MPAKKKTTTKKVEAKEKPLLFPPKPREKLTPGQVLYCYHPTEGYLKRTYVKDYNKEDLVLCKDEKGQGWIVNISHLHKTVLTEKDYAELGQVDKRVS